MHLGLADDKGEISVVSTQLSGEEDAHDGYELVDHLADKAEVGWANEVIKWVCYEFSPHQPLPLIICKVIPHVLIMCRKEK